MIVERIGYRNLGFILFGLAAVAFLIGALVAWSAVDRWRAIAALREHHLARLQRDARGALTAGREAAALLPSAAATGLAGIDPLDKEAPARLERLRREVSTGAERTLVDVCFAFSEVARGERPTREPVGADGELIARIDRLNRGEPDDGRMPEEAPRASTLALWLQLRVRRAWAAGDVPRLAESCGQLALLLPKHPDGERARVVAAALDATTAPDTARSLMERAGQNAEGMRFLRQLLVIAPGRAGIIVPRIPDAERTVAEREQLLLATGGKLDLLVASLTETASEAVIATYAGRCFAAERPDLARKLLDRCPPETKPKLQAAIAWHEGDVTTLHELLQDRRYLPVCTRPILRGGQAVFHVGCAAGLVPRGSAVVVKAGGATLAADRVTRRGTLVGAPLGAGTSIEILVGSRTVFAGEVQP